MIIWVDDITNGVGFGVVEKFQVQANQAINEYVLKQMQLLAPPNCLCIQGEKALNFSKLLTKNKSAKNSKISKTKIGWYILYFLPFLYILPFIFPKMPGVNKNQNNMPALPISIERIVQFYKSLSLNFWKTSP